VFALGDVTVHSAGNSARPGSSSLTGSRTSQVLGQSVSLREQAANASSTSTSSLSRRRRHPAGGEMGPHAALDKPASSATLC
jgi:hypothetical protein